MEYEEKINKRTGRSGGRKKKVERERVAAMKNSQATRSASLPSHPPLGIKRRTGFRMRVYVSERRRFGRSGSRRKCARPFFGQ